MRSCLIAAALARRRGLPESEVAETYYTALLMHVGCSALSHETAAAWGNEQRALGAAARTNLADPSEIAGTLLPAITEGMSPAERSRVESYAASPQGQQFGRRFDTGSCEVASATARRVGLGAGVERALKEAVEWWNGEGPPDGLQGEEIALPARIARASADAARFAHLGGTEAVADALRRRSGGILDPSIVETLIAQPPALHPDHQLCTQAARPVRGQTPQAGNGLRHDCRRLRVAEPHGAGQPRPTRRHTQPLPGLAGQAEYRR